MTTWWSVLFETAGGGEVDPDAIDDLLALLQQHDGAVSAGGGRWSARIAVEAVDAPAAVEVAGPIVFDLAAKTSVPLWPVIRLEVVTFEELEAELDRPQIPELLGSAELQDLLGVTRQRLGQLRKEKANFPKPLLELAAGPVWARSAIDAFLETWERKSGRPPAAVGTSR